LVTDVFGFVDVLIRFKGQSSRSQQVDDTKPMKAVSPNFGHRSIWIRSYADRFWGQMSRS